MITHQELTTPLFACSSPALVTISPAWRVLAQTSQWCAHGRPSATWSSATWPNTASSKPAASCLPCLPAPLLRLTRSSLTSIHLGSARHDKAAGAPPNALSSIYLRLHSTKWKESIMMLLFLYYYYYYYMIMLCMYIYIHLKWEDEKQNSSYPSPFPFIDLQQPTPALSPLLTRTSLSPSSTTAMDASKTLVKTSLCLLLAVYENVNILLSVMNLLTSSSVLPFIFPPFVFFFFFSFGIVLSCPCAQSYCEHPGMHVVVTTAMHFHLMMEDELPFVPSLSLSSLLSEPP